MVRGRRRALWDHTASVLAMLHAAHRTEHTPQRSWIDFHPIRGTEQPPSQERYTIAEVRKLLEKGLP